MEGAKARQLEQLAFAYRRQLLRVDRDLQRAKLASLASPERPQRPSKSPKRNKLAAKTKKSKNSKTMMALEAPAKTDKNLSKVKDRKKSFPARSRPVEADPEKEKDQWRQEYMPLVAEYLRQTYAPYEAEIEKLKKAILVAEAELEARSQGKAIVKTSVDDGTFSEALTQHQSLGRLPEDQRVRLPFSGVQGNQGIPGSEEKDWLEVGKWREKRAEYEEPQEFRKVEPENDQFGVSEVHFSELDFDQREVEDLRDQVTTLELLLGDRTEEDNLRTELQNEEQLVKDLAVELQLREQERKSLYSELDKLKQGPGQDLITPTLSIDEVKAERRRNIEKKIEELKLANTELAMLGRDFEDRNYMLEEIESNLQEYHDEFCKQINDPEKSSPKLYNDYLQFLVDGYKHFLQQLINEEIAINEYHKEVPNQAEHLQSINDQFEDQNNPYLRLLNKPQ